MSQRPPRRPPQLPKEEPAVPLEPAVAKARSSYIRDSLQKIIQLKEEGKTEFEIREHEQVGRFATDYPQLFKKVMSEGMNDPSLRTMLAMLERMGSGELTQHQASVIVGQRLHDIYIKPRLDENN
jgi:hypothetical protein